MKLHRRLMYSVLLANLSGACNTEENYCKRPALSYYFDDAARLESGTPPYMTCQSLGPGSSSSISSTRFDVPTPTLVISKKISTSAESITFELAEKSPTARQSDPGTQVMSQILTKDEVTSGVSGTRTANTKDGQIVLVYKGYSTQEQCERAHSNGSTDTLSCLSDR